MHPYTPRAPMYWWNTQLVEHLTYLCTYMHTCLRACTHKYIHHTHTHMHIYTQAARRHRRSIRHCRARRAHKRSVATLHQSLETYTSPLIARGPNRDPCGGRSRADQGTRARRAIQKDYEERIVGFAHSAELHHHW